MCIHRDSTLVTGINSTSDVKRKTIKAFEAQPVLLQQSLMAASNRAQLVINSGWQEHKSHIPLPSCCPLPEMDCLKGRQMEFY